jgi:hypothetical protein
MKELSCRFEMLISPEQNKQWKAIAKSQNLTKAELIRRTMESYLQGENTEKEWQIYQKLGLDDTIFSVGSVSFSF